LQAILNNNVCCKRGHLLAIPWLAGLGLQLSLVDLTGTALRAASRRSLLAAAVASSGHGAIEASRISLPEEI
jgi:hypothetical protein